MTIGDKISGWLKPRRAAKRSGEEQQRLLNLYWNRAELKKELGSRDDQLHLLQDRLKQQEAATQRAIDGRESLETLLGDPQLGATALVHFQLRGLWRACHLQLAQFGSELRRQHDERERQRALIEVQRERQTRLQLAADRLAQASEVLAREEQALALLRHRLARANSFWHYFKRRTLGAEIARQGARALEARAGHDDRLAAQHALEREPLPEFGGLSLEGRRAINNSLIAYAQLLYARLEKLGLAERARLARTRAVNDASYGDRAECLALMGEIAAALALVHAKQDVAAEVRTRTEEVRTAARYRLADDALPEPGSLPSALRVGGTAVREPNVLTEDFWDLNAALLP